MPHFMIVLILYINLLTLFSITNVNFFMPMQALMRRMICKKGLVLFPQGHSLMRNETVTVSENSSLYMTKISLWIKLIHCGLETPKS